MSIFCPFASIGYFSKEFARLQYSAKRIYVEAVRRLRHKCAPLIASVLPRLLPLLLLFPSPTDAPFCRRCSEPYWRVLLLPQPGY